MPAALRLSGTWTTARLLVRPIRPEDADATAALMSPGISAGLISWPERLTPAAAAERIAASLAARATGSWLDFAICRSDGARLIGWIGFGEGEDKHLRLGYWVGEPFQRQGYLSEALGRFRERAARESAFAGLEGLVYPDNLAGLATLARQGFSAAGEREVWSPVRMRTERMLLLRRSVLDARYVAS